MANALPSLNSGDRLAVHSHRSFPPSATHDGVAFVGIVAFLFSTYCVCHHLLSLDTPQSALFIIGVTAAGIILSDILLCRLKRAQGEQQDTFRGELSWPRNFYKLAGLFGSMTFIALLYWLFSEYHGSFYNRYFAMLQMMMPAWCLLALPYIAYTDLRMRDPYDGYWHMGKLVTLHLDEVNYPMVWQLLLGWIIKGFFLPLMFTYFCNYLNGFARADFSSLHGFKAYYEFLFQFFYFIDVGLCCLGYIFALRLIGTHIRSAEPTMLGWACALVCYEPFYSLVRNQYLGGMSHFTWGAWLANVPVMYELWGCAILLLTMIYVWATISFGARFSNLTHRGIITSGPYRFTKHPAYIAKNLSWWMISVPFIVHGNVADSVRQCVLLLMLSSIYLLRAKTEERHLSRDPVYVAYCESIAKYGIFRFLSSK